MQVVKAQGPRKGFFCYNCLVNKKLIHIIVSLAGLLLVATSLRFIFLSFLAPSQPLYLQILGIVVILLLGTIFVLTRSAEIIEATTEVLSEKTKLAGGLLQSLGTAFPDMILGVSAAFISMQLRETNYDRAINFAIIAAATTFGSNIYNIGHAAWCVWRQNLANQNRKKTLMFPPLKSGGVLTPIQDHPKKPALKEFDTSISLLVILSFLTAVVAISMVIFGRIPTPPNSISGDLYQLSAPLGAIILLLSIITLLRFRKTERVGTDTEVINTEENYYRHHHIFLVWISLLVAGISILFAAESMVKSIEVLSELTHTPFVIAGILTGIVGCLGEMLVVHNFSVNPNGRIGDAIVGVAMDNIVTITGACFVAIMGGIFLGGSSLIIIFVLILSLNTVLIGQIAKLKNYFLHK